MSKRGKFTGISGVYEAKSGPGYIARIRKCKEREIECDSIAEAAQLIEDFRKTGTLNVKVFGNALHIARMRAKNQKNATCMETYFRELEEYFGFDRLLKSIDEALVYNWIEHHLKLQKSKNNPEKTLSAKSQAHRITTLIGVLRIAHRRGWIQVLPDIDMRPFRRRFGKREMKLDLKKFNAILEHLEEPFKTCALLMYCIGQRNTDALNTQWSQIRGDMLNYSQSKTGRTGQAVKMPGILLEHINQLPRTSLYLFPSGLNNGRPWSKKTLLKRWKAACIKAGFEPMDAYLIKHLSCMTAAEQGDIEAAQSLVGHLTREMFNYYSRPESRINAVASGMARDLLAARNEPEPEELPQNVLKFAFRG